MSRELCRIEIPNYIKQVQLTKTRRAKKNSEGIVTNASTINKPRYKRINGQDLWSIIDPHLRAKMAREIKKYFYDLLSHIDPIENYPIGVNLEFYGELGDQDIDNLSLWYRKCIHDALAGSVDYKPVTNENGKIHYEPNHIDFPPKIPDDNVNYIREANTKFIESDEEKLTIIINEL